MMVETKSLMTYANYATKIGVTQQSVRNYVRTGMIKSVNIDGRLFVILPPEEVDAWIHKHK